MSVDQRCKIKVDDDDDDNNEDQQTICAFQRCQDLNLHTIRTAITDPEKESKLPGQVTEPV